MNDYLKKICSLDNIHQWEERDSIVKESVSQHSFKVAAIAAYVLEELKKDVVLGSSPKFTEFAYNALKYALLHDFDESIILRDMSHKVKYNTFNGEEIRKVLNDFVGHELEKVEYNFVRCLDDDVRIFVKLCDWIALLTFCQRNRIMGTQDFLSTEDYCINKMHELIRLNIFVLNTKYEGHKTDLSKIIGDLCYVLFQ